MVSDIDNRVRNIVYEFLKELVINKKKVFEYYMIERRIISRLGLSYDRLPNDTASYHSLQVCLNDLLADKIINFAFFTHDTRMAREHGNSAFLIPPHGVKCIEEGQLEPAMPTLNTLFDSLNLHPSVLEVSEELFKGGHYDAAIEEAAKMINNKIKDKAGRPQNQRGEELDGTNLIDEVFKLKAPTLAINDLSTDSEQNEQKGFISLCKGLIVGLRNPRAHETQKPRDPFETLHYLAFMSVLARKIDEAKVI